MALPSVKLLLSLSLGLGLLSLLDVIISSPHGMTLLSPRIPASLAHDQNDHRIPPSFGCYPIQLLLNLLEFSLVTKRNLTFVFFVNLCQIDLWSFWLNALTFVSSH